MAKRNQTEYFLPFQPESGVSRRSRPIQSWERDPFPRFTPRVARTSISHPFEVDFVSTMALPAKGRLGVTFVPGRYDPAGHVAAWDRNLAMDLDVLKTLGCTQLVSLIEEHELKSLRVEGLVSEADARGILVRRFPVLDGSVPKPSELVAYARMVAGAYARILKGETVVVHCRGGKGRAGTFAACVLRTVGWSAPEAIALVRAVRLGAIENPSQERFIAEYPCGR